MSAPDQVFEKMDSKLPWLTLPSLHSCSSSALQDQEAQCTRFCKRCRLIDYVWALNSNGLFSDLYLKKSVYINSAITQSRLSQKAHLAHLAFCRGGNVHSWKIRSSMTFFLGQRSSSWPLNANAMRSVHCTGIQRWRWSNAFHGVVLLRFTCANTCAHIYSRTHSEFLQNLGK